MTSVELRAIGDVVDVPTAARYLGIGESLTRSMIKAGELPALRLGRLIRIRTCDLITLTGGGAQ